MEIPVTVLSIQFHDSAKRCASKDKGRRVYENRSHEVKRVKKYTNLKLQFVNCLTYLHKLIAFFSYLPVGRADTYLDDNPLHLCKGSASDLENNVCSFTAENSMTL